MSKSLLARPAALALILVNFIPLWGVLFRGWDVANILHLYWAENVAYGVITLLKILTNRKEGKRLGEKLFLSVFFSIHYGLFCYGHGSFVFGNFGLGNGSLDSSGGALEYLQGNWFLVAGFFVSHLFSFFVNYHGKGEAREMDPGRVMMLPYGRIVILHVTIVIGGMAVAAMGSPTGLILVLVIVKTLADLMLHFREHKAASVANVANESHEPGQ